MKEDLDNLYLFTKYGCNTNVYVGPDGYVSFHFTEFPDGVDEEIKIEFFRQARLAAVELDARIRKMEGA